MILPTRAVSNALNARIAAATSLPVAWPNVPFTRPADGSAYLWVQIARLARDDATLGGETPDERGRLVLTIVAPNDSGAGTHEDTADALAAAFPARSGETVADAYVQFDTAAVLAPETIDGLWQQPVVIPFRVHPS